MSKLVYLRTLNEKMPRIAERVIAQWGTPDLDSQIDTLIREAPKSGLHLTPEIIDLLKALKQEHLREFPQFVVLTPEVVRVQLETDENFRLVAARFPHIAEQIVSTWGRTAFHWYVDSLFKVESGGSRQGFPKEVVVAIFRLTQAHDEAFPNVVPKQRDLWANYNEL